MNSDLKLSDATILDLATGDLRPADIHIADGRIEAITSPAAPNPNVESLDASAFYAIPGFTNAHTHSHNALSRGLGDAWSLELLLNYGPALNARRTPEDHYWAALLNGVEMLKSGTTRAYDLVIHAPLPTVESLAAVAQAYRELGLRAVVAPAVADRPFYEIIPGLRSSLPDELGRQLDAMTPAAGDAILANVREALRAGTGSALVQYAVAPTIPAQCSDPFLLGCAALAREFGVGLHTHLAESRTQAVEGLRRYGVTLTAHLAELGLLGPELVAAHAIWLTHDDTRLLAEHGVSVAHNPASNLKLGNGVAPVREFLAAGVNVGIGTDGSASSDNQNIIEAMRYATNVSRLRSMRPAEWLDAPTVLALTVQGGARCCGHDAPTLGLAVGDLADIVLLRKDSVYLQPANDLPAQLLHAESGGAVDTVLVAGEIVLRGGVSTREDEAVVGERAQSAIARVRSLNAAEWELARRLTPYIVETCSGLAATPYPVERLMLAKDR